MFSLARRSRRRRRVSSAPPPEEPEEAAEEGVGVDEEEGEAVLDEEDEDEDEDEEEDEEEEPRVTPSASFQSPSSSRRSWVPTLRSMGDSLTTRRTVESVTERMRWPAMESPGLRAFLKSEEDPSKKAREPFS